MKKIKILIADSNELIREGVKAVVKLSTDIRVVAEAAGSSELIQSQLLPTIDLVIMDYSQPGFSINDLHLMREQFPSIKILALTERCDHSTLTNALKAGINGHILYCCDRKEITDAIRSVANGERFYCGKVLDVLNGKSSEANCGPVTLSPRETEIIGLVAEGLSNKQIAEKLFLSTHTVITHRKNIMHKLGVNNTAGIVMYAVKENIINPNKYLFDSNPG